MENNEFLLLYLNHPTKLSKLAFLYNDRPVLEHLAFLLHNLSYFHSIFNYNQYSNAIYKLHLTVSAKKHYKIYYKNIFYLNDLLFNVSTIVESKLKDRFLFIIFIFNKL